MYLIITWQWARLVCKLAKMLAEHDNVTTTNLFESYLLEAGLVV